MTRIGVVAVGFAGDNVSTLLVSEIARAATADKSMTNVGSVMRTQLPDVEGRIQLDIAGMRGFDVRDVDMAQAVLQRGIVQPADAAVEALRNVRPWRGVFRRMFVAPAIARQASHVVTGSVADEVRHIQKRISDFKAVNHYDHVILLHQGSVEMDHAGFDSVGKLSAAIAADDRTISPTMIYAYAAASTGCSLVNGTPQTMLCPAIRDLLSLHGGLGAGKDLRSGQTWLKSLLAPGVSSTGKPITSIISYNALSNNDGLALSSAQPRQTKLRTKSRLVQGLTSDSYPGVYQSSEVELDHNVTIDTVANLGNIKIAYDHYSATTYMGGKVEFNIVGNYPDSLLACGCLVDLLVVMAACVTDRASQKDVERLTRGWLKQPSGHEGWFEFHQDVVSHFSAAALTPLGAGEK